MAMNLKWTFLKLLFVGFAFCAVACQRNPQNTPASDMNDGTHKVDVLKDQAHTTALTLDDDATDNTLCTDIELLKQPAGATCFSSRGNLFERVWDSETRRWGIKDHTDSLIWLDFNEQDTACGRRMSYPTKEELKSVAHRGLFETMPLSNNNSFSILFEGSRESCSRLGSKHISYYLVHYGLPKGLHSDSGCDTNYRKYNYLCLKRPQ